MLIKETKTTQMNTEKKIIAFLQTNINFSSMGQHGGKTDQRGKRESM